MAKKTAEEKLAEHITEALDSNSFEPTVLANVLVNNVSLYTQDKISELLIAIIEQQDRKYYSEWEAGRTSEGLMLSSHLAEVISVHRPK